MSKDESHDQISGMIRDSEIKFQCRLLLTIISLIKLPKELEVELLEPIQKIIRLENTRLDQLKDEVNGKDG